MNMLRLRQIISRAGVTATVAGLFLTLGCGDDTGLAKRYPVSGTVTYHDAPLEKGQITFLRWIRNKQREAAGTIENGRYTLTTATAGDGALPGEYGVTVTSLEVDNSKVIETITKHGGGGRQHEIGKATAKGKSLVPGKYKLPETGGLKATVTEGTNKIDFTLTDSIDPTGRGEIGHPGLDRAPDCEGGLDGWSVPALTVAVRKSAQERVGINFPIDIEHAAERHEGHSHAERGNEAFGLKSRQNLNSGSYFRLVTK